MRKIAFLIAIFALSFVSVFAQDEPKAADVQPLEQIVDEKPSEEVSEFLLKKEIHKRDEFSKFAKKVSPREEKSEEVSEAPDVGQNPKSYQVFVNHNTEWLSNGFGIRRTTDISVHKKFADKKIVWGGFRNTQRRAIHDQQIIGGFYTPFAKKWGATAEVEVSPENNFIGKVNLLGKVEHIFPKGWIGHGGVRFRSYRDVNVITSFGTVERYWGNNLAGYTFNFTNLSSGGTAPSHRVHYSRYYGERVNSFGFAVAGGQEVENLGPGLGVQKTDTWSVSGSVRHWLTDSFGIMIDGNFHRQGDIYNRRGLNFGVRYRF